jgi:hypothetical protein
MARVQFANGALSVSGSNGLANSPYFVITATNLALPRNQWTPLLTNQFDSEGNFSFTNAPDLSAPHRFYLLELP